MFFTHWVSALEMKFIYVNYIRAHFMRVKKNSASEFPLNSKPFIIIHFSLFLFLNLSTALKFTYLDIHWTDIEVRMKRQKNKVVKSEDPFPHLFKLTFKCFFKIRDKTSERCQMLSENFLKQDFIREKQKFYVDVEEFWNMEWGKRNFMKNF